MSGPLYPNQPLVEVATEIRFEGDLKIELIRSEFQADIRKAYPVLSVPTAQQGVAPALQPIRFERDDKTCGIQLAINSLSFYSRKYPGHEVYLEDIRKALALFSKKISHISPTRVGWRYINSIAFVREDEYIPIHRIFGKNSILGSVDKQRFYDISLFAKLPFGENVLSVKIVSSRKGEQEVILFDLDAVAENFSGKSMPTESLIDKIDELHDLAYKYFEASITKEYRLFLEGNNDE